MVLADLVRRVVDLGATLAADFQPGVQHRAATGALDEYAKPVLDDAVTRPAIVTTVDTVVRNKQGQEVVARTKVVFLADVAVTYDDAITLPGGKTAPILRIEHAVLPTSGGNFVTIVFME